MKQPRARGSLPIPYFDITFYAEIAENGTITTGTLSGYGDFPFNQFPDIPVIDFKGNDGVMQALKIPDSKRPQESQPKFHAGTLETYLKAIMDCGVTVHNWHG